MNGQELLKTKKSFAVIGATQNPERYGYELVHILKTHGYHVIPVNPKYQEIEGIQCYPSLQALDEKPDVVIIVLAPANAEQALDSIKALNIETVWMPRGCWSDAAVEKCRSLQLNFVYDECPVGMLKLMK